MVKVPAAGEVKTRLHSILTPNQCKELATCFLQDVEAKAKHFGVELIIAFSPSHKKGELSSILQYENLLIEQKGNDLGERMFNAFDFSFKHGVDASVMIGTDSPTMPNQAISDALGFLEGKTDVVLGKTDDGGYYLLGLRTLKKDIFENVEWSSERTFDQTVRNIANIGLRCEFVKTWYDIDFAADLLRLTKELESNPELAPRTSEWLKKI